MLFKRINNEELKEAINYIYDAGIRAVIITLVDGNSICGLLPPPILRYYYGALGDVEPQNYCYSGNELFLVDRRQFKEKGYRIPFDRIAGISALSYSQKGYPTNCLVFPQIQQKKQELYDLRTEKEDVYQPNPNNTEDPLLVEGVYHTKEGFEDSLLDELYIKAKRYGFPISYYQVSYLRPIPKPFAWGELKTVYPFPIYADWEYINRISGGLNSIGAGLFIVSGSVGWQKSLYGIREQLMEKNVQRLDSINQSEMESVVISAYIDIVRMKKGSKMSMPYEVIEGEKWFPVILSEKRMSVSCDFKTKAWCVGYMKEACILVPKTVFESIQEPVKIQGEIIPISISTSFGNCKFAIKIRNISSN